MVDRGDASYADGTGMKLRRARTVRWTVRTAQSTVAEAGVGQCDDRGTGRQCGRCGERPADQGCTLKACDRDVAD